MLRTFSKAHGLAGLRLGWLHAPTAVCDVLDRARPVFNVSAPAAAAATAALGDGAHLATVLESARRSRRGWSALAERLGFRADVAAANFAFLPDSPGLAGHLAGSNIAVLALAGYGLPDAVRISFGTEAEDAAVWAATEAWAASVSP